MCETFPCVVETSAPVRELDVDGSVLLRDGFLANGQLLATAGMRISGSDPTIVDGGRISIYAQRNDQPVLRALLRRVGDHEAG